MSVAATTRSAQLMARAERLFPGGVNSPVRAFRSVGGIPRVIDRAAGADDGGDRNPDGAL